MRAAFKIFCHAPRHHHHHHHNKKFNLFNSSEEKLENSRLGPLSLRISAYRDRDGNLRP
jgi:hypothetical protein